MIKHYQFRRESELRGRLSQAKLEELFAGQTHYLKKMSENIRAE